MQWHHCDECFLGSQLKNDNALLSLAMVYINCRQNIGMIKKGKFSAAIFHDKPVYRKGLQMKNPLRTNSHLIKHYI